jgi:hypothetical protein
MEFRFECATGLLGRMVIWFCSVNCAMETVAQAGAEGVIKP